MVREQNDLKIKLLLGQVGSDRDNLSEVFSDLTNGSRAHHRNDPLGNWISGKDIEIIFSTLGFFNYSTLQDGG